MGGGGGDGVQDLPKIRGAFDRYSLYFFISARLRATFNFKGSAGRHLRRPGLFHICAFAQIAHGCGEVNEGEKTLFLCHVSTAMTG